MNEDGWYNQDVKEGMLRMNRKQAVVLIFVLVAISLMGCNKKEEKEYQQYAAIADVQRLEQILKNNCNQDGGYHEIFWQRAL